MADQNHFERSINAASAGAETLGATGNISATSTVVEADTSNGPITVSLPDQAPAAGQTIVIVKPSGLNDLTIAVQTGDSLDGAVDGTSSILVAAGAYASATFVSTGASWAQL